VFTIVNQVFVILQHVPPLCDYKVWIDTVRGPEAIKYLCSMARLNMTEEEFHACRMEHRRATYFAMRCEMDREEYKEKRDEERARKRERARRAKEAFTRGGHKALKKGKWPHLTQD
jgi:hypothetical protein